MSAVRVAVLGNSFASMIQLPALRWAAENGAPNEVVAIAGHGLEKAQATAKTWGIPVATDRWEDVFDSPLPGGSVDLVIISTPVHLHAPMVRAAIDADVAILCEKPFALDGHEARELRGGARGRLGMPYSWWFDEARGGGTLGAIGSHMLDGVVDQFGTTVESVVAELATFVKERERPDGACGKVTADEAFWLSCRMHDGLVCHVESSVVAFGAKRDAGEGVLVEYSGSEGTFRLEGETELPGAASFDDAVHVMDILDAARASAHEGQRIAVRSDA